MDEDDLSPTSASLIFFGTGGQTCLNNSWAFLKYFSLLFDDGLSVLRAPAETAVWAAVDDTDGLLGGGFIDEDPPRTRND